MRIELYFDKNKIEDVIPVIYINLLKYIDIINFNNYPYTETIDVIFNSIDYFKYDGEFLTLYFKHKHNVGNPQYIGDFNGALKIDKSLMYYKPSIMAIGDNEKK